ncbi:rhodanese-like domain-containing protein [Deinococcus indicus]|nr:rhodanese-like domain-containing protein [Deinococcus indicus]
MKRTQPEELAQEHVTVVDVRSQEEFDAGHVPGAVHVPIEDLESRLAELPVTRPVVAYCNMFHPGSSRGERAAALLAGRGFDTAVLEGGYPAWRDLQDREAGVTSPPVSASPGDAPGEADTGGAGC